MKKKYTTTGRIKQKLQTRKKILKSAQEFINNGVEYTLEDVAKASKISRATIYRYYSNVDLLSAEAILDLQALSSEVIFKNLKSLQLGDKLIEIQTYYNNLVIENESAFRKYLGILLNTNGQITNRGARRVETIQMAMENETIPLKKSEIKMLSSIVTLFMGMEAFIVTKDVCGLNNLESKKTLQWGLEMVLKGMFCNQ